MYIYKYKGMINLNWDTVYTSLTSSIAVTTVASLIFKGYLNNWFNKTLENHKSELLLITEKQKNEYQKQLQDFSLFNTKRHEIYPHLFSLLIESQGYISQLTGLRTEPDFTEYSSDNLNKYLEKKQLLNSKIREFVTLLEHDSQLANKEIKKYLKIIEPQIANGKYSDAKNYYLLNELYLSNTTSELVDKCLQAIGGLIIDTEYYYVYNERPDTSFSRQKQTIDQLVQEVKALMREELSRSDIL